MDRSIVSTYKRSLYRPRWVEGVAVPSNSRAARHEFKYFKSLEEKKDDKPRKSSAKSSANSERLEYPDKGE
jgi:hypothetical protein